MTNLLKEICVSHVGAGGEILQTFDIPVPRGVKVIHYSYMVTSTGGAPITNRLDQITSVRTNIKDWLDIILATVFNNTVATSAVSNTLLLGTCSFLRYSVRSNAVTGNQFFLLIKFTGRT